jgi:hypothetical protein
MESFEQGADGELIVALDVAIMHEYVVTEKADRELETMGYGVMGRIIEDHPDLKKVTMAIEERGKFKSIDVAMFDKEVERTGNHS